MSRAARLLAPLRRLRKPAPLPRPRVWLTVEPLGERVLPAHLTLGDFSGSWSAVSAGYYVTSGRQYPQDESLSGTIGGGVNAGGGSTSQGIANAIGEVSVFDGQVDGIADIHIGVYYPVQITVSASFQGTATYTVEADGEATDTPVDVGLNVSWPTYDFTSQFPDNTYTSATYQINGESFTVDPHGSTRVVHTKVGQELTISFAGSTSETASGNYSLENELHDSIYSDIRIGIGPVIAVPIDLATDPASGIVLSADGSGIDYSYSVLGAAPPDGVPVAFYWATGPGEPDTISAAYSTTLTGADATVGDHTKHLDWSALGTRPTNAKNLLMALDPADATHPNGLIAETDETNNVAAVAIAAGDIKVDNVTWSPDRDGLLVQYTVVGDYSGYHVPVDLIWGRGENPPSGYPAGNPAAGFEFEINEPAGTYTKHIPKAQLTPLPRAAMGYDFDAGVLYLSINPNHAVPEKSYTNNAWTVTLTPVEPTAVLLTPSFPTEMGQPIAVAVEIANPNPFPIEADVSLTIGGDDLSVDGINRNWKERVTVYDGERVPVPAHVVTWNWLVDLTPLAPIDDALIDVAKQIVGSFFPKGEESALAALKEVESNISKFNSFRDLLRAALTDAKLKDTTRAIPYSLVVKTGIGAPISLTQAVTVSVSETAIKYAKEYLRELRKAAFVKFAVEYSEHPLVFASGVVSVYLYQTAALDAYENALEASGL